MESIKDIRNDALVQAYHTMHQDKSAANQNAVTRQMVSATFLVPVQPVRGKLPEDFPPKLLKDDQGKLFVPLFTDMEQVKPGGPQLSEAMLPVDISDAFGYLTDNANLAGAIVNAFDKPNLICRRALVENIAKLWSRVKTAEMNGEDPETAYRPAPKNLQLMVPKVYPDGVVFALSAGLAQQPDIVRAWMCIVQDDPNKPENKCDWMIILEAEEALQGREDVFRTLGTELSSLLNHQNVIFTEVNDKLRPLTEKAHPLYVRKDSREDRE